VLKDVTAEQRYQLTTPILLVVVRHGCYDRLRVKLERRRTGMNVSLLMFLVVRFIAFFMFYEFSLYLYVIVGKFPFLKPLWVYTAFGFFGS